VLHHQVASRFFEGNATIELTMMAKSCDYDDVEDYYDVEISEEDDTLNVIEVGCSLSPPRSCSVP